MVVVVDQEVPVPILIFSDKGTLNVISNHIQTVLGRFSLRGYHLF